MISRVSLKNFKCYPDLSLPLSKISLLTGLNSAGKSTVIQALLLLRQSFQAGLLQQGRLLSSGPLVELGTAGDLFSDNTLDSSDILSIELEWDSQCSTTWAFQFKDRDKPLRGTPMAANDVAHRQPFGSQTWFLSAERIGPRTSYGLLADQATDEDRVGIRGEFTPQLLNQRGGHPIPIPELAFQSSDPDNPIHTDLRAQVEAWLGVISPGVRLESTLISDLDSVKIRFGFESPYGVDHNRRPVNVGFGLSYVLPIVVLLLSAPRGSLVIIENPEAHLHPQGQSALARLMARAAAQGVQLLVETHSDHILNGLRLSVAGPQRVLQPDDVRLLFFERRQRENRVVHEVLSPRLDARGRLDFWPEGFFDTWEKDLDALLEV